jgi:hypothetical protein
MQPHFCGQHESQHGAAQPQLGSAAQPQLGAASQPHPPLPKYAEASEALASAMATPRLSVDSTKRFIGRLLKKWGELARRSVATASIERLARAP